jgi:hypothetical protein
MTTSREPEETPRDEIVEEEIDEVETVEQDVVTQERARPAPAADAEPDESSGALIPSEAAVDFRSRWDAIQASFVDEPRRSVEDADGLVGEVIQEVANTFEAQRTELERHWDSEGISSTEELRVALKRYRNFFEHLLNT